MIILAQTFAPEQSHLPPCRPYRLAQPATPDAAAWLLPLPLEVIYELLVSPAVRLAAGETELTEEQLGQIADACWRAISQPNTDQTVA